MKSILLTFLILFCATATCKENKIDRGITSNQEPQVIALNKNYDRYFQKWSKRYSADVDFQLIKAVCAKESKLNPRAISSEKALGLCQFMKSTWISISKQNIGIDKDGYFNPEQSIRAASFYLSSLHQHFKGKPNSIKYTLAAFNAGIGNILKADKLGGNNGFSSMINNLHRVTGRQNAITTKQYVEAIVSDIQYE